MKKKTMRHLLSTLLLSGLFASGVKAAELELALSPDSINGEFILDSGIVGAGGADLSLGLFYNEDDDVLGNLGLLVSGMPAGQTPFTFGLGARFYAGRVKQRNDQTNYNLAIGGRAKYTIPANIPMHASAQIFYAPNITSWSDSEQLLDFGLRYEIEFVPQTSAFVGYRLLKVDLDEGGNPKLDNNVHLGIHLSF
jgi:hypothetical protein